MKRLSQNLLSILGGDLLRRLLGFLSIAYLARTVGVAGFGVVNFAFTVLSYVMMIASAGMNVYGTRETSRGIGNNLAGTIISTKLANSLLLLAVLLIVAMTQIRGTDERWLVLLVCAAALPNAFSLDWYYQGKERMAIVSGAKVISAAIFLIVLLGAVRGSEQLIYVGVAALVGDVLATLFVLRRFRLEGNAFRIAFRLKEWKSLMGSSLSIGIGSILAHLSINFPVIYLGIAASKAEVGLFSAASKLVFFLLMIDRVLGQLLLPASSRLHTTSPELLKAALERSQKWILVLGLPITVGGVLLSERLLVLVFGAAYSAAAPAFTLLLWYFFFTLLHTVYTSGIIASGNERAYRNVMFVSAALFGFTIMVGTALAGIVGAALAVCLSEGATLLLMRNALRKSLVLAAPYGLWQIVLATAAMSIFVVAFASWSLAVIVSVAALVYAGIVLVFSGVTKEEMNYVRSRFV